MLIISPSNYIRCCFNPKSIIESQLHPGKLDIFYVKTEDLNSKYSDLKKYISIDEQLRADKLHFDADRKTYISCHAMLRLILAKRLNANPLDISFLKGINNKPGLLDNPFFFNIAHTREAFSIAISRSYPVGIDLERMCQNIDLQSIIETYFSKRECEYILNQKTESLKRFFLLWTRKEALLKAIGTGIIDNLTQIEVSDKINLINQNLFNNLISDSTYNEYFIYSKNILDNYLSVAFPSNTSIKILHLKKEDIFPYLN